VHPASRPGRRPRQVALERLKAQAKLFNRRIGSGNIWRRAEHLGMGLRGQGEHRHSRTGARQRPDHGAGPMILLSGSCAVKLKLRAPGCRKSRLTGRKGGVKACASHVRKLSAARAKIMADRAANCIWVLADRFDDDVRVAVAVTRPGRLVDGPCPAACPCRTRSSGCGCPPMPCDIR